MKDKIGITLTFDNILKQDHIKLLPITHLQILFQNKLQFLYPTEQDLYNVRSYLKIKLLKQLYMFQYNFVFQGRTEKI